MDDSLRAAPYGPEAVRMVLPKTFNWSMFLVALALMAAPVAPMIWTGEEINKKRPLSLLGRVRHPRCVERCSRHQAVSDRVLHDG